MRARMYRLKNENAKKVEIHILKLNKTYKHYSRTLYYFGTSPIITRRYTHYARASAFFDI